MDNRESSHSGHVCLKKDCKFKHKSSGRVCTKPEYDQYGRCNDYFTTCEDLHPFPDKAKAMYGSPQAGWRALCEAQPKKKKGNKKGKAFPIISLDSAANISAAYLQEEQDEEVSILQTVLHPQEEEDEISMIANITTSDSDDNEGPNIDDDWEAKGMSNDLSDDGYSSEHTDTDNVTMSVTKDSDEWSIYSPSGDSPAPEPMTGAFPTPPVKIMDRKRMESEKARLVAKSTHPRGVDLFKFNDQKARCEQYENEIIDKLEKDGAKQILAAINTGVPTIMLDSGAFRHIAGTDLINSGIMYDITDLPQAEDVSTACGDVTLSQEGKINLRDITFTLALNKHMRISLLSEGQLFVQDKWEINGKDGEKECIPPRVESFMAEASLL